MDKHVVFAKLILNNWNLPRGRYLWMHFDEKWFWGLVLRAYAKACEMLGLDKQDFYAHHKSHIDKVMAVAIVGYAFDTNVENGGHGLKIGLFRCQGARIAKKLQRERVVDENGNYRYSGPVIRRKGDTYLVDCNVTGSDEGTSDKPKFSLLSLFRDIVFPYIRDELVGPGKPYEGFTPIIQGDLAGPHNDEAFVSFCQTFCAANGMHWIPQAPQMPYGNVLDLAVFPSMSKRHSLLLDSYGRSVVPADRIWETAETVWNDMPSATIARGYVLAYRTMKNVVKFKGKNNFLHDATFHAGVRESFYDTEKGIKPKINVLS
jgi:hypothetical protein